MFRIDPKPSYRWPVTVHIPQDGGKTQEARFWARFRLLSTDAFQAVYASGGTDEDLLKQVLVGWEEVADEGGEPLPFNEETRSSLIAIPYVRMALIAAYLEMSQGRAARPRGAWGGAPAAPNPDRS